jgi:hypothetical protein
VIRRGIGGGRRSLVRHSSLFIVYFSFNCCLNKGGKAVSCECEYRKEGNSHKYTLYLDGKPTGMCIFGATVMPGTTPIPGVGQLPSSGRGMPRQPNIWLGAGGEGGNVMRPYKSLEAAIEGEMALIKMKNDK